jgi:hypothetical protein
MSFIGKITKNILHSFNEEANVVDAGIEDKSGENAPESILDGLDPKVTELGKKVILYTAKRGKGLNFVEALLLLKGVGKLDPRIQVFNYKTKDPSNEIRSTIIPSVAAIKPLVQPQPQQKEAEPELQAASFFPGKNLLNEFQGDASGRTPNYTFPECVEVLQDVFHTPDLSAFMWGAPGVGKTAAVLAVGKANRVDTIIMVCSQMSPEDLLGLPTDAILKVTGIYDNPWTGKKVRKSKFGISTTVGKAPAFLPVCNGNFGEGGIMFFDEMNTSSNAMLGASLTLLTGRQTTAYRALNPETEELYVKGLPGVKDMEWTKAESIGYKLPSAWRLWAAGNRSSEGGKTLHELPANVRSRFRHFTMVSDKDAWLKYITDEEEQDVIENAFQVSHDDTREVIGRDAEGNPKFAKDDPVRYSQVRSRASWNTNRPLRPGYHWEDVEDEEAGKKTAKVIELDKIAKDNPDVSAFIDWKGNEMLEPNPEEMEQETGSFPSQRTWARIAKTINSFEVHRQRQMTDKETFDAVHSLAGPNAALQFTQFVNLRRFFPHAEIEKMYTDSKNAILLPTLNENLANEKEATDKLVSSISGSSEGEEKAQLDKIKKTADSRQDYTKVKTVTELIKKGLAEQGADKPGSGVYVRYRPDVMSAVQLELGQRLKGKLEPVSFENLIDYTIKLCDPKTAAALVSAVTNIKANPKFKETYSVQRNTIFKKFVAKYPEITKSKSGKVLTSEEVLDGLDGSQKPGEVKKEHLNPDNMVDLLRLCEQFNPQE